MDAIPPSIDIALDDTIIEYWRKRVAQHKHDSYAGVPIWKWPEDLRTFEHLLWQARVDVVIELGTLCGGSAMWFRDRLNANIGYGRIARRQVITIDLDQGAARRHIGGHGEGIDLVEGDIRDPELPGRIAALVPAEARCLVVEDTAHTAETTWAALSGFAPFVASGSFLVVEDTSVDVEDLRIDPDWPRGVLTTLADWLDSPAGAGFSVAHDLELYGVTCHPGGFLQRA